MAEQLLIYKNLEGNITIDVHLENETVWLTQEQMSNLFGKSKSTINEHIKNIYAEGELVEEGTLQKFGNSEFQQKAAEQVLSFKELEDDIKNLKNLTK